MHSDFNALEKCGRKKVQNPFNLGRAARRWKLRPKLKKQNGRACEES
jgi:hypothetical protein